LTHQPADSFSIFKIPVETSTTPGYKYRAICTESALTTAQYII